VYAVLIAGTAINVSPHSELLLKLNCDIGWYEINWR